MQRRQFVSLVSSAVAITAAPVLVRSAYAQEAGLSAKSIAIGCSADVTGPLAAFGEDIRQGAGAALAQINGRGGIHGRTLQLNIMDDKYEPPRTVENVKQMLSQGNTFALLSCVGTANNKAILPMTEEVGMVHVGPVTGASSLRKGARSVFHVRASYTAEVHRLIQRLLDMNLKSIGVVYLDNLYGREMLEDAIHELDKNGISLVVQAALATDSSNLPAVLTQVTAARPAAVLLATAGSASVGLVRGLKKNLPGTLMTGISATLMGDGPKQLGQLASGIALSLIVPNPFNTKTGVVRDYQAAMRAIQQPDFSPGSLDAYINMRVLAEGLERAGPAVTQDKLRSALAGIRKWNLGDFVIDYSGPPPYVGSRFIDLGVLGSNGRFIG
ncbi:ABC transporter substrate-binding protein [Simplicispira psychrophila]|uniref:ABC transporter substrate-binding protein n=1 Tax=Simplicispira psychrophila TaxID=80882 RepID=UPI0004819998|nr:ABC transporter substrate-binding protein [Simplicispira psychrophila]